MGQLEWGIVQDILKKHVPGMEVWAFGSRVTGDARPYSDLDLVVIPPHDYSPCKLAELRWAFAVSDLPWKVDVLDWRETDEKFKRIITRKRILIQAA